MKAPVAQALTIALLEDDTVLIVLIAWLAIITFIIIVILIRLIYVFYQKKKEHQFRKSVAHQMQFDNGKFTNLTIIIYLYLLITLR